MSILARLEEPTAARQTADRHWLAPPQLTVVLALEKSAQGLWTPQCTVRGNSSDQKNVAGKSAVGRAQNSWRVDYVGLQSERIGRCQIHGKAQGATDAKLEDFSAELSR